MTLIKTDVNKMAKMTIIELNEKVTEYVASGAAPAWFADSILYTTAQLDGNNITESGYTHSIVGMCKSLGASNPLAMRSRASLSPTLTSRVAEYADFEVAIATAFDLIPEGLNLLSAKKSSARPDAVYADGADWASVIHDNIMKNAKAAQKAEAAQ